MGQLSKTPCLRHTADYWSILLTCLPSILSLSADEHKVLWNLKKIRVPTDYVMESRRVYIASGARQ